MDLIDLLLFSLKFSHLQDFALFVEAIGTGPVITFGPAAAMKLDLSNMMTVRCALIFILQVSRSNTLAPICKAHHADAIVLLLFFSRFITTTTTTINT